MVVVIPPRKGVKKRWPAITITNPGRGLNNVISDEYIANEEASSLENIQFRESGCPAKRNGYTTVGTGLVSNPKGLASYYPTSALHYLLTIDGTELKYLNGTTWTAISGVSFTADLNTTFVQARGDMYIWNGSQAGAKLTSALTLTRPATTVSAAFGIFYQGKQIVAGTSTNVSRLYISSSTAADDFTVATGGTAPQPDNSTDAPGASTFTGTPGFSEANIIDISKDDGDKITGLAKFQEKLIVFKERSIYQLTFDASTGAPTVIQLNGSVGCVSHRSIENVENDVYFLSRGGYYTLGNEANYQTIIRTNELSVRIHPVIETITPANLPNTCSIYSGFVFYSSISTGGTTTNNATLTYDRRFGAWSKWTNVNANAFTEFIDSSNVKHLYFAADDQAQVFEIIEGTYSDNGDAISSQWTSKAINFGDFSLYKQILYIDFEFRQIVGSVTLNVITDGGTVANSTSLSFTTDVTGTIGDEMWGDPMWGGGVSDSASSTISTSSANVPYRLQINKVSRTLKLQILNSTVDQTWVFLAWKIYFRPYAPEKFPANLKLQGSSTTVLSTGGVLTDSGSSSSSGRRVVSLSDGATITPTIDDGDVFTFTLGGNRIIANPTGTPTDGQQIELRIRQDGTGNRTVTWGSDYRFSTDIPTPTLTTTANKTDYLGFQYDAIDGKWDCLAVVKGY